LKNPIKTISFASAKKAMAAEKPITLKPGIKLFLG
jgi:hypothetical protein